MYKPVFQKVDLIDERNLEALNIDDYIKYAKKMHFLNMYVVKKNEQLDVYSMTNDTVTNSDIKTIKGLVIDD